MLYSGAWRSDFRVQRRRQVLALGAPGSLCLLLLLENKTPSKFRHSDEIGFNLGFSGFCMYKSLQAKSPLLNRSQLLPQRHRFVQRRPPILLPMIWWVLSVNVQVPQWQPLVPFAAITVRRCRGLWQDFHQKKNLVQQAANGGIQLWRCSCGFVLRRQLSDDNEQRRRNVNDSLRNNDRPERRGCRCQTLRPDDFDVGDNNSWAGREGRDSCWGCPRFSRWQKATNRYYDIHTCFWYCSPPDHTNSKWPMINICNIWLENEWALYYTLVFVQLTNFFFSKMGGSGLLYMGPLHCDARHNLRLNF